MSRLAFGDAPRAASVSGDGAHVFIKPQLMSSMPASSFKVSITDLQRTRISDIAPVVAATLAQQAQDYPMARSKFDGNTDGLMFSVDGFVFSDASGHMQSCGSSIPPSQMDSSMALMGYKTSGQTLHVCHASDLKRALKFSA